MLLVVSQFHCHHAQILNENDISVGDILKCHNLRTNKQNGTKVRGRARIMNDHFGIVMDPPFQINNKTRRKEVRLRWIYDRNITLP